MINKLFGILFITYFSSANAGSALHSQPPFLATIGFPITVGALLFGCELVRRGAIPTNYGHGTKPGWIVIGISAIGVVISGYFYYGTRFGLL